MKMNTEDSCKGVFFFYIGIYLVCMLNMVMDSPMSSLHR